MNRAAPRTLLISITLASILVSLVTINTVMHWVGYKNKTYVWGWANETTPDSGHDKPMFVLDPTLIYAPNTNVRYLSENEILYDDLGTRPNGATRSTRPDTTILFIGDSFTWGYLLDQQETLPAKSEQILRSRGADVNVYNGGVNGYGSDQEFTYLQKLLPTIQPDIVVWNMNVNDVEDNMQACLFRQTRTGFTRIPGWRNTLYVQGKLLNALPSFITNSSLGNLMLYAISPGWSRTTLGCPRQAALDETLRGYGKNKLQYLVNEFRRISDVHHFSPVILLAPFQGYLDPTYPKDSPWITVYGQMVSLLSDADVSFINTNTVLEQALTAPMGPRASNDKPIEATATPTISTLFIDEGKDANGHWHPTGLANHFVAQYLTDTLLLQKR